MPPSCRSSVPDCWSLSSKSDGCGSLPKYFVGAPLIPSMRRPVSADPYSVSAYVRAYARAVWLSSAQLEDLSPRISEIVIAHDPSLNEFSLEDELRGQLEMCAPHKSFAVHVTPSSLEALTAQGYRIFPASIVSRSNPAALSTITICDNSNYVTIQIGRCNCYFGRRYGLLAVVGS